MRLWLLVATLLIANTAVLILVRPDEGTRFAVYAPVMLVELSLFYYVTGKML